MSTNKTHGFSVNVFLPSGDPDGLKLVEKSNWTGQGLVIPRTMFGVAKTRRELDKTGVYFLIGPDEKSSLLKLYVGEGDPVKQRLEQHAKQKDFWTHAVVFTSKDGNLNKAHVQLLESRMVKLAQDVKRCVLDNSNFPTAPSLSEADAAMVEGFLDDILVCMPILGYSLFSNAALIPRKEQAFYLKKKSIEAIGFEASAGFVVLSGSHAVSNKNVVPSLLPNLRAMRLELIQQEVLVADRGNFKITQDYTFNSPSSAAGVLLGHNCNGRVYWKNKDGKTLKEIQDSEDAG